MQLSFHLHLTNSVKISVVEYITLQYIYALSGLGRSHNIYMLSVAGQESWNIYHTTVYAFFGLGRSHRINIALFGMDRSHNVDQMDFLKMPHTIYKNIRCMQLPHISRPFHGAFHS